MLVGGFTHSDSTIYRGPVGETETKYHSYLNNTSYIFLVTASYFSYNTYIYMQKCPCVSLQSMQTTLSNNTLKILSHYGNEKYILPEI